MPEQQKNQAPPDFNVKEWVPPWEMRRRIKEADELMDRALDFIHNAPLACVLHSRRQLEADLMAYKYKYK